MQLSGMSLSDVVSQEMLVRSLPERGVLVPKQSAKDASPDNAGTATHRLPSALNPNGQRAARHRVDVALRGAHVPPIASTQANGRIVRSVSGINANFQDGPYIGY
jgi:hypothetical protein